MSIYGNPVTLGPRWITAKKVSILPFQAGVGDPSPSNHRPISGYDACEIWVSPTPDPADGTTYQTIFGNPPGTVYGGEFDLETGVLTVDRYLYVYDGTETNFRKSSAALNGFYNDLTNSTPHSWPKMWNYNQPETPISSEISSMFKMTRISDTYRQNYGYCYLNNGMNFNCDPDLFGTTVNSFKAKLAELYESGTPVSVFANLATPITYQLTPQQIQFLHNQYFGANCGPVLVKIGKS